MPSAKQLLILGVTIAAAGLVVYKELNPPRKIAPVRYYHARVVSAGAKINGQLLHLILDTGSATTRITKVAADQLGLKSATQPLNSIHGLSDQVYLTLGGHTFIAPLEIEDYPDQSAEGFISWPAIRDNILVFDPVRHVIRAVAELPAETAGWLKLKVRRNRILEFEVTLPDGKNGAIAVDTGSGIGLDLPSAQWQEWRTAHPQATVISRPFNGPFVGQGTVNEIWADKIQLGPITLTDVPVREAPPREEHEFINNFAGLIGLYALTRMDLVVDAKNDVAYIHPRDAPGPPYPPFKRQELDETASGLSPNWSLDGSVQTNAAAVLLESARFTLNGNDTQGALTFFNQIIKANPDYAEAYLVRGAVKITLNDWKGALADFTRAIELDPKHAYSAYYFRGVEHESLGQYEEALADYAEEIELNSVAVSVASLRQQALLLRLHRPAADFATTIAGWKDGWTKTVGLFLTGNLSEEKFLTAAATGTPKVVPTQQCSANYYIGLLRFLKGDPTGAREYWQKAIAIHLSSFSPSQYCARAELARLDAVSTK